MGRPSFQLTDDHARKIMKAIGYLQVAYPTASDNRALLDGLIRVMLDVTGRLYGVPTYQRILRAYAPSRRPSTATILSVLVGVQRSFASSPAQAGELVPSTATAPPAAAAAPGRRIRLRFGCLQWSWRSIAGGAGC